MAVSQIWSVHSDAKATLEYVVRFDKSLDGTLVFSNRCSIDYNLANLQMEAHREKFGKNTGVLLHHGFVSFKKDEISAEAALEFAKEFMQGHFAKYQYLGSVHVDTEHIHFNFVINSVGLDGKKYNRCDKSTEEMRAWVDRCCEQHGLSVVVPKGIGKTYKEYLEEKAGNSWKAQIAVDIDAAIEKSSSFEQFLSILREDGYFIKQGENVKHMVVKKQGMEKGCRVRKLGEEYTEKSIRERIKYKEFGFTASSIKLRKPKRKMKLIEKEMQRLYYRKANLTTNVALGIHVINALVTGQRLKINAFPPYKKKRVMSEAEKQIKVLEKQLGFMNENKITSREELEKQMNGIRQNIFLLEQRQELLKDERKHLLEIKKNIGGYNKFRPIYENLSKTGDIAKPKERIKNQWGLDKYVACKTILEQNGLTDEGGQSVFFNVCDQNKSKIEQTRDEIKQLEVELDEYFEIEETLEKSKGGTIADMVNKEINREELISEKQK